jgi:hypothetical protein
LVEPHIAVLHILDYLQAVQAAQGTTHQGGAVPLSSDATPYHHHHPQHVLHVDPAALDQHANIALARGGSGAAGSGSLGSHSHAFHDAAAAVALQGLLHQAAAALAIQPEFNSLTPQEQAAAVAAAAAAAAQAAGLPLVVQGPPTAEMLSALPDAHNLQGVDIQSGGVMQHYPPGTTVVQAAQQAVPGAVQYPGATGGAAASPFTQPATTAVGVEPMVPPPTPLAAVHSASTAVQPAAVRPAVAVPHAPLATVPEASGPLLPLEAQTMVTGPRVNPSLMGGNPRSDDRSGQQDGTPVALECVWSPCVAISDHAIAEVEIAMTVAEDIALRVVISRTEAVVLDAVVPLTAGQQQCVRWV